MSSTLTSAESPASATPSTTRVECRRPLRLDRPGPQRLRQRSNATNAQVSSPINFNGAGLRVAGAAVWLIAGGFGLYGQAAGSLLAGDFRMNLYEATAMAPR